MKNNIAFILAGLLAGLVIAVFSVFYLTPQVLLKETKSGFDFETTIEKFEKAVIDGGWKIPAKHNLRETLLKSGKSDVNNVLVFEICNPDLAEKILLSEDEKLVSSLLPCRVAFYEKNDGNVYFSRMNSGLLSRVMGKITRVQMKQAFDETEEFLKALSIN